MRRIQRQNGTQPQLSTSTQDSSANQPPLSIPYEDDVRFPNRQDVQISPCCATCLPQACSGCFNAGWYYQDSCGHICGLPTNYNTDCFPSNRTYCNDLCNYCSCCCNCTPKAETSVRQIQNNPAAETRNIAVGSSPSKIEGPQNQRRTKTLANKAVQSHIEEATGTKPSPRKSIKMIKSGKNIGVQVLTSKQSTVPGPANVGTFQEPVPTRRLNDPSVDTLSIQDFRAFVPTEIDAYPEVGSSLTPTKPVSTASQVLPKFKPPSIFHFEPNTRPRNLPSNPKHSMPTDEPVFKMSEPRADTVIPRPPGFVSSPKIETTTESTLRPIIKTKSTPTKNVVTLWTPNTTLDGTRESTFSKIEPSTAKAEGFDEDVVKILTQDSKTK
ncbi:unnamed protein product [Allacma fusca]|uniref:Uncharacterized protein n=1 Tax=Allacma fusca TaxID=39272 RepID=A0A8J2JDB9_9HEXA|nr:unnamed protein product [Allacma fusca]